MANIRDVAKHAQVSITTVSRVLKDDGAYSISNETRQKVINAIDYLNYKPKQWSKCSGKEKPTRIRVGCILNAKSRLTDNFYMSILAHFEEELREEGGELVFIKSVEEITSNKITLRNQLKLVNRMLIMECLEDDILQEIKTNVEYIIGVDIDDYRIDRIGYDRFKASVIATQHLINCGHRCIAFIGGSELGFSTDETMNNLQEAKKTPIVDWRYMGYYHTLSMNGITYLPELVKNSNWDRDKCEENVSELLSLQKPPTAIIGASDYMAISAISKCCKLGFYVPNDISIIGISDIEEARYSNPPLTTVNVSTIDIGVTSARLLSSEMVKTGIPKTINVPLKLIKRDSVKVVKPI